MPARSSALLLLLTSLAFGPARAAEPAALARPADPDAAIDRILVLGLTAQGVEPVLARNLSDVFAFAVADAKPQIAVLGQAEVRQMLALEAQRQLVGCENDVSCLAEIAGALGADHLALGTVGRIGRRWLATVRLVSSSGGRVVRQLHTQVEGDSEPLLEAMAQLGGALVDPARPVGRGLLDVVGEGEVSIDDEIHGPAPISGVRLPPGVHVVRWRHRGEWSEPVRVRVEAYRHVRVEPGAGVQLAPVVEGDLGGLILVAGLVRWFGTGTGAQGMTAGWGPMLKAGWAFQNAELFVRCATWRGDHFDTSDPDRLISGGGEAGRASGTACSFGGGADFGAPWRLTPTLGIGLLSRDVEAHPSSVGVSVDAGLETAFALTRYLEVGAMASVSLALSPGVESGGFLGLTMGIPSQRLGQRPPRRAADDPMFWVSAAAAGVASTWMILQMAQDVGP